MTGATNFTRKAGLMGLLSLTVSAAAFIPLVVASRAALYGRSGPGPLIALMVVVVVVLAVVAYVGLLVRHRDQWWIRPVVVLVVLSVAAWAAGENSTADALGAAATILLGWGMARAGRLPRSGAITLAVGAAAEPLVGKTALGAVAALAGAYGFLLLSWAMWREPLPREAEPAEAETPLAVAVRASADAVPRS